MFGDFTDAERDFLFDWETGNTKYTQGYVEGFLTGDTSGFFELPGGPIGIAVGATYREDKINDVPGEITLAGNAWQVTTSEEHTSELQSLLCISYAVFCLNK